MDWKTKQVENFDKLGSIIFGKNLTDWFQLRDVLSELNDVDLTEFAYENAYLVQQWFNENRRK